MGVTGLWKLIEPCGKPVPVETLEGKILAVDISIWLHQAVKGFQDNKGAALNNAHLLGLFHRLCKLMYYRVKPVFVFDGCVPQLKRDTIARRQQQRSKLNIEADRIQALLLQSLAKEKMVQQALGPNAEHLLTSPIKKLAGSKANRKDDAIDDMFKLPELPESNKNNNNQLDDETTDDSFNESSFYSMDGTTSASTDDSSFDESNPRNSYSSNLQAIDVRSKDFLQLPADVRHEILVDIKETRKQSSWGRLHELPSHSDDFSTFQMKRLLKRRDVQVSLETAEQEMGGRSLTFAELTNIFTEEGILETDLMKQSTKQISSDEHTRFLLVRDLKKKLTQFKDEKEKIKEEDELKPKPSKLLKADDLPSTSKASLQTTSSIVSENKYGNEYDADLELAMALSLEEDKVYDEKDYDYNSDESLKLTKDQRYNLQNAAKGPARSYMIEYAGMNKDEVVGIMEKTQTNNDSDDSIDIEHLIGDADNAIEKLQKTPEKTNDSKPENKVNESQEIRLCVSDDSDATDSDLEEVEDVTETAKSALNIIVDIKKIAPPEDDLFADVFDGNKALSEKIIDTEDECVIEETPPCLNDDDWEDNSSNVLNIKVDISKPLKPEEDLFADIFEKNDVNINEEDFIPETPSSIKDQGLKEAEQLPLAKTNTAESKTPPRSEKILSILDELKQQADEIKNIRLENIKLNNSIIEISDDELPVKASVKTEVIEICDSDDNKRSSTPPPQLGAAAQQSPRLKTKSPKLKTPSKNHSITEFFDVNYVVKRTPDKPLEEETEVAKVKSPFFIRKTPKSGRKSNSNSPSPNKKMSKANKTLFTQENENSSKDIDDIEKSMQPIIEPTTKPNEQDIFKEAAELLKSNKTTEELNNIASDLANERRDLENERNRQDRMGMSITQRMNSDCQDLLRLFGVPFIVAPMEAEAQCAFLDIVQLTNGTITDDSDIWLFGGRTVYKNFFAQNKHVLEFRSEQIEKDFQCDRKKLIQLACLVGSDYTAGIHGIGAVTALEILASFTSKDLINETDDPIPTSIQHILATLQRFRNWWETFKSSATPPGSSARLALQKKLKNIEMHEGFPSVAVVEAYLTPKVDDNKDTFSWGYPDVESLREFTRKTFGWTTSKTDDILMPVIKKLNEKRTQQSIRNYFNVKSAINLRQMKVSKRVKNAIDKMSGNVDSDNTPERPTKAKRAKKATNTKKTKVSNESAKQPEGFDVSVAIEPSCSNQMAKGPLNRTSKRVNIPNKTEIIPQREKDLAQLEENKRQAAEILKNSAKATKKKRKA